MNCPVCKLAEQHVDTHREGDRCKVRCARCGQFEISGTAMAMLSARPADFRLSSWIRTREDVIEPLLITSTTLEGASAEFPIYSVSEKQILFLRWLAAKSEGVAGKENNVIPEFDFPVAACASVSEFQYIIKALMDSGDVVLTGHADPTETFVLKLTISPNGWRHFDALDAIAQAVSIQKAPAVAESQGKLSWDVFISHASEDKETFAKPLADALSARGVTVWFDTFTLSIGDSLRGSIDRGLRGSRYGVVILSEFFFQKHWPQVELDALVARESLDVKVILPVWHGIDQRGVCSYSPLLAGRLAVSSSKGVEHVAEELTKVILVSLPHR